MRKSLSVITFCLIVALVCGASFKSLSTNAAPAVLSSCGPVAFSPASNFGVGSGPQSVAVGDFNGDGKADIVTANQSNNVSVLLGNGAGSFGAAVNYPVSINAQSVAIGDFNGDGKQDLAVAAGLNAVWVLLGDGTGAFGTATSFNLNFASANSIVVSDFNGDGKQDLATADTSQDRVSVLLGNGSGSFAAATSFFIGSGQNPSSITVGDLNGDGKQDLITADTNSSNVTVLLGDGAGNFSIASYSEGAITSPFFVITGDFNNDGKLDVATADANTSDIAIMLGDGAGALSAPSFVSVPGIPLSIAVVDLDGDGKLDLATANAISNNVSVLLGDGAGNFGAPTNFGAGTFPFSIAAADLNGDSQTDLVAANNSSNDVSVLLRQCSQTNNPPVAKAKNITVSANSSGFASVTATQVDNGSFDPDSGDTIMLSLNSTGPFSLGAHQVTLTATDNHGASSSAIATVTVVDTTPPMISCPAPITVDATKATGAVVNYPTPTASDSSGATVSCTSPSGGTFAMGTTTVTCTATDGQHNSNSCSFNVAVRAPRKVLQDVLAQLIALRNSVSNRNDREELADAIQELNDALDSQLWMNDSHLRTNRGDWAFHEEKDGIHELLELVRNRHSTIPDSVLQGLISRLVQADRVLALVAISDAIARHGDARIIARANAALADGDSDAAAGRPNLAIGNYREAWDRALRA